MSRYDDVNKAWDDRAFKGYSTFTDRPVWYAVLGVLVLVAVIAAIVLGGWWIGWWFKGQNVNRESHLIRNGFAAQQTLRDEVTTNIGNVLAVSSQIAGTKGDEKVALRAQRKAIVSIVCRDAAEVTGDALPADQVSFVKANCEAGNVSPSSPYN